MKQNKYDDPAFFANYSQMARSIGGLDAAGEWPAFARASTNDTAIEYRRLAIEDMDFLAGEFDVVISSLVLHYVEHFDLVCRKVHHCLVAGGSLVLSVEHPVFTALAAQDWYYGPQGERLHWPLDQYQEEGPRQTRFLDHEVVKYHRTVATYVNTVVDSGFTLTKICEPQPTQELLDMHPEWQDETRRPMFLLIAALKQEQ